MLILALAQWVIGCAVVRVQVAGKDDVEVKQRFGIVSIEVEPGSDTVLVDSTSFGVINSFGEFAVGYHDATMAVISADRCQIVLWIRTNDQLTRLDELLRDRTGVCVVNLKQGRGEHHE